MPHRFKVNQKVALKDNFLEPGTTGTVMCLYDLSEVPAYWVRLPSSEGNLDNLMYEDELTEPTATEAENTQSALD